MAFYSSSVGVFQLSAPEHSIMADLDAPFPLDSVTNNQLWAEVAQQLFNDAPHHNGVPTQVAPPENDVVPTDQDCAWAITSHRFRPTDEDQEVPANVVVPTEDCPGPSTSCRFRPTDAEVVQFLREEYDHRFTGEDLIAHQDVYNFEPHQLKALAKDHGDGKMYFFTTVIKTGENYTERGIKSKKGYRWKATQSARAIRDGRKIVGYKRPLKYWQHKTPTSWLMSEYTLEFSSHSKKELVVAVIYEHKRNKKTN